MVLGALGKSGLICNGVFMFSAELLLTDVTNFL